jgi:hypothetical protein
MSRAIVSKVLPATDTRGTRISAAFATEGETVRRKVFAWNYAYSASENHALAVRFLLNAQRASFGLSDSAPLGNGQWVHVVREVKGGAS